MSEIPPPPPPEDKRGQGTLEKVGKKVDGALGKVKDEVQKISFKGGTENVKADMKDANDKLEIIICGEKVNNHYTRWFNNKYDYYFKIDDLEYNVRKESLLKMSKTFWENVKSFFRYQKIREKFCVFFDDKKTEPKVFDFVEPKVSSKIVYIAINAQVTTKGIASLFQEGLHLPVNAKTLLLVCVGAAVAIILVYGYTQGWFVNIARGF